MVYISRASVYATTRDVWNRVRFAVAPRPISRWNVSNIWGAPAPRKRAIDRYIFFFFLVAREEESAAWAASYFRLYTHDGMEDLNF